MGTSRILLVDLCSQFSKLSVLNSSLCYQHALRNNLVVPKQLPFNISWRFSHSFFSRITADKLWKGVTSVSSAGRKKGRGRGSSKRLSKDLNKGQVIGFGKKNMIWPGLNAPIIRGREIIRQHELPPDEDRINRMLELRDKANRRKNFNSIHPLERGWSGTKLPGRSLGPPDPVGDETFEGFDSRVIEFRTVSHMTGERGRVRRLSATVVVGNKKGLAGFAMAKSPMGATAANSAKNKAAKVLRYIELDGNTVIHDFFYEFGPVRIFVEKRPPGYGLYCHRAIRAMCDVIGIKDLYAKVEGSTGNIQCLARAFFAGLMRQKSLKQIANEKGLYVIKMRSECDNYPEIVASPDKCRTEEEIYPTEVIDFQHHVHGGKVKEARKKWQPFYINFPSYIKEMKDRAMLRHERDVRIHLLSKYGEVTSFLQIREKEKAEKELKYTVEVLEDTVEELKDTVVEQK